MPSCDALPRLTVVVSSTRQRNGGTAHGRGAFGASLRWSSVALARHTDGSHALFSSDVLYSRAAQTQRHFLLPFYPTVCHPPASRGTPASVLGLLRHRSCQSGGGAIQPHVRICLSCGTRHILPWNMGIQRLHRPCSSLVGPREEHHLLPIHTTYLYSHPGWRWPTCFSV